MLDYFALQKSLSKTMTAPHPPLSQKRKTVILNPHTSEIKTFPHLTPRTPKTPLLVRKKKHERTTNWGREGAGHILTRRS